MKFCDMCGKELNVKTMCRCVLENITRVDTSHDLCNECKEMVKKFIKFQSFRNSKENDYG